MAICVIIIGGKFEQVHQSLVQEKKERRRTSIIAGVTAHAANPNLPDSAPNTSRSRVLLKLSTGSPRMKRQQEHLAVENMKVRVSNIEGKLETVISECPFCTSVVK